MNWIPSLILKKIIPAFTQVVWGSTRDESTSMDMEPTAKTPTGGKGSFACGRAVKAAWPGLPRCGAGFFSRKAGTSGRVAREQRWVYFILSHPTFALCVRKQFKNQKNQKKATVQTSKLQLLCCLRQSRNLKGKNRKRKKIFFHVCISWDTSFPMPTRVLSITSLPNKVQAIPKQREQIFHCIQMEADDWKVSAHLTVADESNF